jgi:hypothetical protein
MNADFEQKKADVLDTLRKVIAAMENDRVISCNVSVYHFAEFGAGLNKLAEIMYTGKNRYIIDVTLDESAEVDHEKLR